MVNRYGNTPPVESLVGYYLAFFNLFFKVLVLQKDNDQNVREIVVDKEEKYFV